MQRKKIKRVKQSRNYSEKLEGEINKSKESKYREKVGQKEREMVRNGKRNKKVKREVEWKEDCENRERKRTKGKQREKVGSEN